MGAFRTEFDLRRALKDARLQALADDIVATVRPALIFARRQRADDELPAGTCKMGGLPDLPLGMDWPRRPPFGDAPEREQALREWRKRQREEMASRDRESGYDAILRDLPEEQREEFRRSIESSRPDPARVATVEAQEDRYTEMKVETFGRSFPLAFLGQLDLQRLSVEAGFDLDLPRHGVLSLFEDITSDAINGSVHVFWFDTPAMQLARQSQPTELVMLSDARQPSYPWAEQTLAEVLEPHSVLTVPFHWAAATGHRLEMYDFLRRPTAGYYPEVGESGDGQAGYFGDRLGGWPDPIQNDPEAEFMGDEHGRIGPGDDRVRHLFSWGGENYGGTRRMNAPFGGDGTTYVMIRRADLLDLHFDKARALYQCD